MHLFQRRLIPTGLFRSPSPPSGTSLLNVRVRTTTWIMATSDVSRLYKAVEAINDRLAARFPAVRPEMTISGRIFPHRPYGVMFFTAPTAPWFALQNFLKFNPLASSHVFITVATPPSLFRQCPVMQITVEIPPLPNIAGHSPSVLRASCATQRQEGEHSIYEPSRHQVEAILRDLDICVFRVLILLGLILPGDTIELETDGCVRGMMRYRRLRFLP
jgi:hypothetical protein